MQKKIDSKRLSKIVLIITFFIVSWVIFEILLKGFAVVKEEFGIEPKVFLTLMLICEVLFNAGIVLILLGSGIFKIKIHHILKLDFQNIKFENRLTYFGLMINRIAAFIPPSYLLIYGWGKMPRFLIFLLITELFIVLTIGILPFEIEKLKIWKK